jgi:hypothetical protein
MKRLVAAAIAIALAPWVTRAMAADAQAPGVNVAEVASTTFVRGCAAHFGALDELRAKLAPGREMYLPQLPPADALPFLHGRKGEVFARFDAGVALVLIASEAKCLVTVQKVGSDSLFRQLDKDLRTAVGHAFTVQAAGKEQHGQMLSRFIDMIPAGDYRAEVMKRNGGAEPAALRVILTTSDDANPNLQAIIAIGTR